MKDFFEMAICALVAIVLVVAIIMGISWGWTSFNVWRAGKVGEAELMQAEWNRQILVREAQAKKDASKDLAQAEIERAQGAAKAEIERAYGVAKANEIIGESLKNNREYMEYLWVDSIKKTQNRVVYIPTEANIPILEARVEK